MPKCETCRDFGDNHGDAFCWFLHCYTAFDFEKCPNHSQLRGEQPKAKIIFSAQIAEIPPLLQNQTNFFHLIDQVE